jgi:hypothetical protein
MSRFSAFFSSAAIVKLKDPVITVSPSMIITLLCAMADLFSQWLSLFAAFFAEDLQHKSFSGSVFEYCCKNKYHPN